MTHKTGIRASAAIGCDRDRYIAKVENQFGFQNQSHFNHRKNKLGNLTTQIFKISTSCKQGIHPRLFCRRWFGLDLVKEDGRSRFTQGQIEAMESEHGYREKCINLLAKLLKIKPNTIHRWGKGVSFDKIPNDKLQQYELYLGYIDAIRVITTNLAELDEASLLRLLQQLEARQ